MQLYSTVTLQLTCPPTYIKCHLARFVSDASECSPSYHNRTRNQNLILSLPKHRILTSITSYNQKASLIASNGPRAGRAHFTLLACLLRLYPSRRGNLEHTVQVKLSRFSILISLGPRGPHDYQRHGTSKQGQGTHSMTTISPAPPGPTQDIHG